MCKICPVQSSACERTWPPTTCSKSHSAGAAAAFCCCNPAASTPNNKPASQQTRHQQHAAGCGHAHFAWMRQPPLPPAVPQTSLLLLLCAPTAAHQGQQAPQCWQPCCFTRQTRTAARSLALAPACRRLGWACCCWCRPFAPCRWRQPPRHAP